MSTSNITPMSNVRGSCWSVTINNPTEKDDEEIARARQKRWQVFGQKEVGENGTPHYQLMVKTPQVRFAAVKKTFSRAHIELAKNPGALATYVHKEDTRLSPLQSSQDLFPSLCKFWELILMYITKVKCLALDIEDDDLVETIVDHNDRVDELLFERKDPLKIFDEASAYLIRRGYNVETLAVNPQTRAAWKTFYTSIIYRQILLDKKAEHDKICPVQTASQPDMLDDTAAVISLPIINADHQEENCT